MKTLPKKSVGGGKPSERAAVILRSLRAARRAAARQAKFHSIPLVFMRGDTLVRERQ